MEQESIDKILEQRVEEFCALTDKEAALDFAIATASQFHEHRTIREPWDSVEHILRFPFDIDDDSHFSKVENSLNSKITVKVYRFYLEEMRENDVAPGYKMPEEKLSECMHNAKYSQSEYMDMLNLHKRSCR